MILCDGRHLVSTESLEELHAFAVQIHLKRAWFQNHRHPHYDVMAPWRVTLAYKLGAKKVTVRELLTLIKQD